MHSERRWELGSKRRLRHLRFRGNGPALVPLLLTLAGLIALVVARMLIGPTPGP